MAVCDVEFTPGDPCTLCITCADDGKRIIIEDAGSSRLKFIVEPIANETLCIDVAIGRTVKVTQLGNSPTEFFLGNSMQ